MNKPQRDVLEEVDELITKLESHPDPQVRDQVAALLERVDAVHRTALTHLMSAIHGMAGEAFVNRLTADPAIRLLLMSYDLVAVDRRLQAEEALDGVRGHLHAHGIDVELLEVVGGVIYARLHGFERSGLDLGAIQHDLEETVRAGLLGFQELVLGDRPGGVPQNLVSLGGPRRAQRPVYRRVLGSEEIQPGEMKAVELEDLPLLLVNLGGEVYALRNRCGDSPLPLEFGTLENDILCCSWHGCRYDVRSGKRLDREGERIDVFPVAVDDGQIRVALGVQPVEAA